MVVSQKHIAIIDPHKKCIKPKSETSPAGTKKKLSKLFTHAGHVSTFESIFNLSTTNFETYNGTIFRFPLRRPNSDSKISTTTYTPDKIQTTLFESLKEESPYILLFLRNVKSISLMEWKTGSPHPQETFRVGVSDQEASEDITGIAPPRIEQVARQISQSSEDGDLEVCIELKSMTVTINSYSSEVDLPHHWLVLKVVGTNDSNLDKLGRELNIFPWVGLATSLPQQISLCESTARTAAPFDDHSTVEATFKQLEGSLKKSQISMKWPSEPVNIAAGHAYCFLPLPESTAMPVHVHGYFAVTDNRRSIKWPMHDEKGKEAQWNKGLLYELVAPAYSLLLSCRASLIHYEDTPLSITNTDHITDAYSTWPLYPEVKNVPIWNELVLPTMDCSSSLPLLWTSACGGKWIPFSEAYFLPGSFKDSSHSTCSDVVIQLLITLYIPVVSLPRNICETIKQSKNVLALVEQREISPRFVLKIIRKHPDSCSSLPREEVYKILGFILSDLDKSTYILLDGIPLLPLKGDSNTTTFQKSSGYDHKYIFFRAPDFKQLLKIIPGADSLIVDPKLPEEISENLCEVAKSGLLQLKEVNTDVICKQLLPMSINSWCTVRTGAGWKWLPGQDLMPPQSWMDALWKWIADCPVKLALLNGLPIIPQLPFDNAPQEQVTLIKVCKPSNMCRLSGLFTSQQKDFLLGMLKKLNFLIVNEGKMNNCIGLQNHPDFEDFVRELSPNLELIIEHLNELDTSCRLQVMQTLVDSEKDFLRKQFSNLHDLCARYQTCLRSLPIYHAYSNNLSSSFIALGVVGSTDEAFLTPDNISPLPDYPNKMLCPPTSPEERSFLKALAVKQLSVDHLCTLYLIPLALKHIRSYPNQWSVGDDLILWILKLQPQLSSEVFTTLSQNAVILTRNFSRKKPQQVYDPQDPNFAILFDVDSDKDYFPDTRYLQEAHCKQALLMMGMKTWNAFQGDLNQMYYLLHDRMNSIRTLQPSDQFNRGQFILQMLTDSTLLQKYIALKRVKFLAAEACPWSYPSCLKGKWYGRQGTLYSIEELCPPDHHLTNQQLIGTVKPILSSAYCHGQHQVSVNAFEKFAGQRVSAAAVLSHLNNIQSTTISSEDADSVHQIVMSIYDYLDVNSSGSKLSYIWWRETPGFMPANKFILHLPDSFQFNLEPFYYCLQGPIRKHKRLFQLHNPLTLSDVAGVITTISQQAGGKVSGPQVHVCVSILNWLCDKQYQESSVLMLTEKCTLVSVKDCVFDDREWMKHSESRSHIEGKSFVFVHDQIPQKVAKHFQVVPLSSKLARSKKLNFRLNYTAAGQNEDITQRIRHIVEEYQTNIDIFKELIQNADDAGATEVKFLIDWRDHPTNSLFTDELKKWQGPALIAFNDATFSDEDFDNICRVAGETKKTDPLKTGRFGVGFCATYHLTDLPSIISRRSLAMFDPHTSYLGVRISAQDPGMRIDLVDEQSDLKFYHDQFKPYDNVFGCNVFDLHGDGYQGTIFRFPFRDRHTSKSSRICREIYDRKMVNALVRALKEQSNELLLFLKHVSKVSVHELEDGCQPSDAKEIFSIQRQTENKKERVELIKSGGLNLRAEGIVCSTKYKIDVHDGSKAHSHTWMVSAAIKPLTTEMRRRHEAKGLLNLAEVAIKITEPSSTESFKILPNTDSHPSRVFCFLPLPTQTKLPFHVNGFFSMGSDRRTVSATDDKTFGPWWNKLLAEGVLVAAFVNLLQCLCGECDLKSVSDSETKQKLLRSYYSLWNMSGMSSLIDTSFASAFKKLTPTLTSPIMWSEIYGGCWLSPVTVYVFKDSRLRQLREAKKDIIHETVANDAISLLMKQGYGIVDIPYHMHEILKNSLKSTKREYDYQRVCTEILFPSISTIDPTVRDRNIKFLIEQHGTYLGKDNWYKWAESFLYQKSCISCQSSDTLRPACQLIDPANGHFVNLFNISEGRFPCKELQDSSYAMLGLRRLGMTSKQLSIADLKKRAESVGTLSKSDYKVAFQRSVHLCEYIDSTYGGPKSYYYHTNVPSNPADTQDLQHLSDIQFLPVKQKPKDVDVPWSGKSESFESPSRVYSSEHQALAFTQFPIIVEVEEISSKALKCLGISSRKPTTELVIANLQSLISHTTNVPNEVTMKFLDDSTKEMYKFLELNYHSSVSAMDNLKRLNRFIWQGGHFLSPSQVVGHWNHSCFPYICELSSTNNGFLKLMTAVGVKGEVTLEMLVEVFKKVAEDHDGDTPISDEVLEFVVFAAGRLKHKLIMQYEDGHSFQLYLPDEHKIMRNVSDLADNVGSESEWVQSLPAYQDFMSRGTGYYVHKSIPHECAKILGVNPLLDAVLKEIEDEDFLSGTDFGQHEDLCDRLNGILRKYPADISIFKEFIQNADDAQATEIIFVMDHRTNFPDNSLVNPNIKWKSLQHTPALCIYNNRKFTEKDIEGITKLGRGGKSGSAELIGKFGVGFNVAYHVTDCPSFVSYSEDATPEYLCVFDPTQSFVSRATKRSPGRKWNFKGKTHHSGFSDQFRPYLPEDLHRLSEHASGCLQDKEKYGHVVFRLPLTRTEPYSTDLKSTKPTLSSGRRFRPFGMCMLLEEFARISQDILLFLNHLKSVSAFEIKEDGAIVHCCTTTATIPSAYLDNCRHFTQSLKQYSISMRCVSMAHRVEITHVQPDKETQITEWLIQRAIGGNDLPTKLLKSGLSQGLRPIAGVATLLKPKTSDHKYLLFCFLPLPIQSNLPIHINGHFLVDDSRKHLEAIEHEGLSNWNEIIAQKVIVPAYVDLVIAVKDLLDENSSEFYYSLFPRLKEDTAQATSTTTVASSDKSGKVMNEKKNTGELNNLNIVKSFYRELLQRNPPILLRELPAPVHSSVCTWMPLKSSLFCVPFVCGQITLSKVLTISAELRQTLVLLGMPITTAPNSIYHECTKVDSSFTSKARIKPTKIIEHLRKFRCTNEDKEVIKNNIICLIQYCISGYDSSSIPGLFKDALYLVAKDGSLQRGNLFRSTFSDLLPQCSDKFIDKSLEASSLCEQLALCSVIRPLPLEFVSARISLSNTTVAHSISDCNTDTIKLLWHYFTHCSQAAVALSGSDNVPSLLNQYFSSKAIIPASDGNLYPIRLSKILVRSNSSNGCGNCQVMKKLGYPSIDFRQIAEIMDNHLSLNRIIDDLTSCFQNGEDIINCFKLQPPKNLDIKLTDDEALAFVASFGKILVNCLKQVSEYLLKLPLFYAIDESRISLVGVTRVFILASTNLPLEGIPTKSENGQVVLKAATTESMKNFYEGVIPRNILASVSPEQFYLQLVLPILSELQEDNVLEHVKYLCVQKDKMIFAFARLKDTPFIKHNGRLYKVCDLCDHRVQFYKTFKPECILPDSWRKYNDTLKALDLQCNVSTDEWLQCAKKFSQNVVVHEAIEKSAVLLQELFEIIKRCPFNSQFRTFLQNVAEIKFLYSPQTWELTRILSTAFPEDVHRKSCDVFMVKFGGSVSVHEANLTCLCKSVLPESCLQLITNPLYKQALQVELPASPETVAENLKCLCKRVSATCARSDLDPEHVKKMIQIFEAHYVCLSKKKPPPHILRELENMMCILPSKSHLLHLVKPSQLVMHLPSDCFLEPYCFKVMQWLQKNVEFLTAVGVKEELRAQDYVDILLSIKREAESVVHDRDSRVIECAYKELVRCLRQGHSVNNGDIYLPDESLSLTKITELCLNDVPWYRNRLPPDCSFKIIYQPPTDDKGHRTLPSSLKVKRLSEIVTEELQDSCKSSDFACNDEVLFEIGKRQESGRCVFVRCILDTLKSDELFRGFCRMYYTEYKFPPTEAFKALVQKLKDVRVRCVISELKSVLSINGQPIPGTEDTSKLCHLCSENGTPVLYITPPHSGSSNDGDPVQFFKDFAICISKLIDNEIKNMGPIAAVFECSPNMIPQVLTREQVFEYSEMDNEITKAIRIGTSEPWNNFSPNESLIVLNFDPEDPIRYISEDGSLINAEIVRGGQCGLLETNIAIRVKENDKIDADEPESATNFKTVSPIQVFKVLTAPQKRSLWSGDTSPYASPVALATIPSDDPSEIEQWLIKIKRDLFTPRSGLVQSILTLRLLGHLYYQIVIQKKNPVLFHTVALTLQDMFCRSEGHTTKTDIVMNLVREVIRILTSGAASGDAQSIFPSQILGDIMEGRVQHVNLSPQPISGSSSMTPTVRPSGGYITYGSGGSAGMGGGGSSASRSGHSIPAGSGYPLTPSSQSQVSRGSGLPSVGSWTTGTGGGGGSGWFTPQSRARVRRGYQNPRFSRFRPVYSQPSSAPQQQLQPPQPNICMRSATAWLEQAKADFKAAETLLGSSLLPGAKTDVAVGVNECRFPALVCFLCHDTVEKCIKGVYYAFCGLRQDLVNCSNLVALHDDLKRAPHHPVHLLDAINECVMTVNRHENRSRFPNYQNYPCAPATIYDINNAQEAFQATSKFVHLLQSEGKLSSILQDLGQLPARRFMSSLQYMADNQGNTVT